MPGTLENLFLSSGFKPPDESFIKIRAIERIRPNMAITARFGRIAFAFRTLLFNRRIVNESIHL